MSAPPPPPSFPHSPSCLTSSVQTLRLSRFVLHFLVTYNVAFASIRYATRFNDEDSFHTMFWVAFLFGIFGQVSARLLLLLLLLILLLLLLAWRRFKREEGEDNDDDNGDEDEEEEGKEEEEQEGEEE